MEIFKSPIIPKTQTDLGYYLAGLIEGDGHFSKNQLIISCHENDKMCFELLIKLLDYGTLKPYSKGRALRFVISSNAGLKYVLKLINGKFVGYNKYNQLLKHGYEKKFNIAIWPPQPLTLNNFWLCGFIDADGCFNITLRKCATNTTKVRVDLRLTVAQKDRFILDQIKQAFNATKIYIAKHSKNLHFRLTITGYKRIPKLINYFDTYVLQTCKYTHFRIFRRCFRSMQLKKHLNLKGLQRIQTWQQTLLNTYKYKKQGCSVST
jgi:LAGLIDADG endonuclease